MTHESVYWWLDWSALPERYIWARLTVSDDGSAEILDSDGRNRKFDDVTSAHDWLLEDEYSLLEKLIADGDAPRDLHAPQWT